MIMKTMTITSIAILIAAVSVATTMTMVQANIDGDDVDITIPAADTILFENVVVDVGVEATSFISDAGHPITVDIHDTDEMVWVVMENGATTTDPIMITIDDIQWVGMTGAIGFFECNENNGASSMASFDKDTLEIIITPDTAEIAFDVHCEFEGFHGSIDKEIVGDCILEVKKSETQECTFNITYDGARATIVDTISAGWEENPVVFADDDGKCSVDEPKGKNKKNNNKSATGFTCDDVGISADFDVTITTRESPGKGHKLTVFKPTSCEDPFDINSGAKAILLDENGEVVLGTLDDKPIVLDSTGFLSADDVVDNTSAEPDILCSEA